jgi:membrane-associated phospholipid phosphatase
MHINLMPAARRSVAAGLATVALAWAGVATAQECGWSRVDHRLPYDDSGVWNPTVYRSVVGVLTAAQVGGAVWEGADSRLGRTLWQGFDAELVAGLSAGVGKLAFGRVRPSSQDNPCLWFQGRSNRSFPSGEAAVAAGLVTPYILEYGQDHPSAYALMALPLYVGSGRLRNQAHWQTDVLAGWVIGGLSGRYAHGRKTPIMVELLPHGFAVGLTM